MAEKPTGVVAGKIADPSPLKPMVPATGEQQQPQHLEQSYNGDLFKEYQKQKQRLQETILQKQHERDELVRQLSAAPLSSQAINNRLQSEK